MAIKKNRIAAIIPARMASGRFPGKPLADILGLPMVEHVRRRVSLCDKISRVIVATCDKEIKKCIEGYGGEVIMTSDKHERCTDRIAEAARFIDADIIVNVQGDEPLVLPQMLDQVIKPLLEDKKCKCINLIAPIIDKKEFENLNVIKAVLDIEGNILFFSREPIPSGKKTKEPYNKYKQLGIVAFTKKFLLLYGSMKETLVEKIESIDMMRFLENGFPIRAVITNTQSLGVDTPEDLKKAEVLMKKDSILQYYK